MGSRLKQSRVWSGFNLLMKVLCICKLLHKFSRVESFKLLVVICLNVFLITNLFTLQIGGEVLSRGNGKFRESSEKVQRKFRESSEKVQRKFRESSEKVQRKFRESSERVQKTCKVGD